MTMYELNPPPPVLRRLRNEQGCRGKTLPRQPYTTLDYSGQEASISARTVSRSAEPDTQSVMPFQNDPAPTSPGIKSEPSKRKLTIKAEACRL